ncbi:MAG TPA: carboxypeptidase regulatory-like domain-containing protein, partial [Terriglobia bacterium]|nr:carboxypeptidase regulatory-like domain-containing protein [Terriglobia bacterium]
MNSLVLALALIQAPVANGSIRGTVLNAAGEPLEAARVEIVGAPQGPLVTRTDGSGLFLFLNIPSGRYRVTAKKEAYVRQEYGQIRPNAPGRVVVVGDGVPVQDIVFRLQPASTIAGLVRNEGNIPIANILVQAFRRTYGVRGNRTFSLFSNALTDDRGAYRLYWVDPGEYYLNAAYMPQLPTPVNANADAPRVPYAPTYYPGFNDLLQARPVRVESDKVFGGIDFRLEPAAALRVTGTVISVLTKAPAPANVTLLSPQESGGTVRYAIQTDEKGVFEMKSVSAGTYVLSAQTLSGDGQIGFTTTVVPPVDPRRGVPVIRGDVVVGPGITINARLFVQSPTAFDLNQTTISLIPLETWLPVPKPSVMQSNGVGLLENVQPGEYYVSVSGLPGDAYVARAGSNARDVLEGFLQVGYETQPIVDILLAFDGGQISGSVVDAGGKPAIGASVVLVPDTMRRHRPDLYRVVTSDNNGAFSIRGIPPGRYKVFAWEFVEPYAYANPEFMLD